MKLLHTILISLFYLLITTNGYSQETQYCATQTTEENRQFIEDNIDLIRYYENEYYKYIHSYIYFTTYSNMYCFISYY